MPSRKVYRSRQLQVALTLVFILTLLSNSLALAEPNFPNTAFKTKWQRADKPVADASSSPARSWLWGPDSFTPPNNATTELYAESPGGARQVLYFDKARMEINNPTNGTITNGLLVRELISGKLATGNEANTQRKAANDIPIAGDASGNDGPTYATFTRIASLNGDNPSTNRTGQPVADTIDKTGSTGSNSSLGAKAKYVYFDQSLKHNIPDVFWNFMNQRGNVFVNGQLVSNQPVLGDDQNAPWLDATGLPLTDAFWAKVTVSGQVKDVLVQAFERRVLTFTPTNDPAFQVEMGNVGRHYFSWRYNAKYDQGSGTPPGGNPPLPPGPPAASAPSSSCDPVPASTGGAFATLKCAPAGLVMQVAAPLGPSEQVTLNVTKPDGTKSSLTRTAGADGNLVATVPSLPTERGLWTFNFKGLTSGKEAQTYVFLSDPPARPTLIVTPVSGSLTQDLTVFAVGFNAGESVRVGAKAPGTNPNVVALGGTTASDGGGIIRVLNVSTLFTGENAKLLAPGDWLILAIGSDPQHAAVAQVKLS